METFDERLMESVGESEMVCSNGVCTERPAKYYKMSKLKKEGALDKPTSIDIEILVIEGLVKSSKSSIFSSRTINHTINFVPNYDNYLCKKSL